MGTVSAVRRGQSHFYLAQALLCLDCEALYPLDPTVFGGSKPCPACGAHGAIPLLKFLNRPRGSVA